MNALIAGEHKHSGGFPQDGLELIGGKWDSEA